MVGAKSFMQENATASKAVLKQEKGNVGVQRLRIERRLDGVEGTMKGTGPDGMNF